MNTSNSFKDLINTISDYRKIVLLVFLIENDKNLLKEIGFTKNDIKVINLEFKNILIKRYEEFLDYVKDQEESILEKFLNK